MGAHQLAVVAEFSTLIEKAAGDDTFKDRTWVLLAEVVDGGWGLWGHAHTNAELVTAARDQLARLAPKEEHHDSHDDRVVHRRPQRSASWPQMWSSTPTETSATGDLPDPRTARRTHPSGRCQLPLTLDGPPQPHADARGDPVRPHARLSPRLWKGGIWQGQGGRAF
jgi:hypothetical protein